MPLCRSRAQIFRYPSPVKTGSASSWRISIDSSASEHTLGPRFFGFRAGLDAAERHKSRSRQVPGRGHLHHTIRLGYWKAKRCGSWFRLPERQRAAILQAGDFFAQQFVFDADVGDGRLQSAPLLVFHVDSLGSSGRPRRRQEAVTPLVRVAAVTRYFRDVLSRSAPRRSSRMTDTLRLGRPPARRQRPTMPRHPQSAYGLLRTPLHRVSSRWTCILSFRTFSIKCSQCTVQ